MSIINDLINCAPKLEIQLIELAIQGIFWFVFIQFMTTYVFIPMMSKSPVKKQWTLLNQKSFKESLMIEFDEEGAFNMACLFLGILCQHGVGGSLCIPSVFSLSFISASTATTLACHGALCEAGWEIQDTVTRIYQLLFTGEDGKKNNPIPLLVILFFHHFMGLMMVIPMNLVGRDNKYYHEGVFLLQFAALVAMGLQQYGYTLNIETTSGLIMMKINVTVCFIIMWYSRAIRYGYVVYRIVIFLRDISTLMYVGGICAAAAMSLVNVLFCLDVTKKFVKFIQVPVSLLDEKDPAKRQRNIKHVKRTTVDLYAALSSRRHPKSITLTKSRKEWAKVRGAVHMMGAMKELKKKKDN